MNQFQLEKLLDETRKVAVEFPIGSIAWHKGNGCRGCVVGYNVRQGAVMVFLSSSPEDGGVCFPAELTKEKPPEDFDGESWKEGEKA